MRKAVSEAVKVKLKIVNVLAALKRDLCALRHAAPGPMATTK